MRFAPLFFISASFLAATALTLSSAENSRPDFRTGAVAVDITPQTFPRIIAGGFLEGRGEKANDALHARCIVLDDGKTKIAFAIVDTCMMPQSLIDEAKGMAAKECGIPTDHMMVSATHTHSAPAAMGCLGTRLDKEYAALLTRKIAEGIVGAAKGLQPARIGWASVDDWEHTHNRSWIRKPESAVVDPFGQKTGRANMHPGYESPDVIGPSGPVDPGLSVIAIQTLEGKPLAVLANYSQHYFGASPVSADYYGAFCKHVANMLGEGGEGNGPFVCAMSQGTSGDLMWMDYGSPKKNLTLDTYAEAVAKHAMEALKQVKYQDTAVLAMVEKKLTLGYRVPDEKRLAWAKPIAAQIQNDLPKDKTEVYARETTILDQRKTTEVKLQAIRIGDLSLSTFPNEVYAITGLKLKAKSPGAMHFNIELANGAEGYIPPPEQHVLGGYTTWPARTAGLEVQAEPKMVQASLGALEEVTGKPRRDARDEQGPFAQTVLGLGPVAYWRLNESAGRTARNSIADGASATLTDGFAWYLPGVGSGTGTGAGEALTPSAFSGPKQINRAVHLAGAELQTSLELDKTDYSIAVWFWLGEASGASVRGGTLVAAPGGEVLRCEQDSQHRAQLVLGISRSPVDLRADDWHLAVLVRQGDRLRVHVDGREKPDLQAATLPQAHKGAPLSFGHGLQGKLDEIVVCNRALSTGEIASLWKASGMVPVASGQAAGTPMATTTPPPAKPQLSSAPLSPEESLKKWHVRDGYRIELAASEPVVLDPVAFDWDEKGRLWVVEMADYPLGMDGNGKPGGRVVMLEDTNEDGHYDKRTVVADGLNFPTGILTWRDGALVTAAPDVLYLGPTGERKVLLTGFSTGNQQLRVNGLRWGMDGWVYCAAGAHNGGYNKGTEITSVLTGEKIALGSRDFRFKPDTGEFDPQSGPSQFGRAKDDWGHWFGVQNSFPLWHYVLQDHYLRRNPYIIPPDPVHQLFSRNPPVYPASSLEKRYHSFGESGRFTSACGIEIYRDRVLFDYDKTHAFTCEPFHNIVQHHVLEDDGVTFKATRDPAETKLDFLASEDRWCRPVMVRTGPDGALWVADMYRYMIEHPQWLPQNGKDELLPHYREGDDKGRIWRVVRAEGSAGTPARIITANFKNADRSARSPFESSNGWVRDKAQMLAVWSGNKDAVAKIEPLIRDSKQPQTRAQDAWTLQELGLLKPENVVHLLQDRSARVREQALIIAENFTGVMSVLQAMTPLAHDADAKVRLQLACTLGAFKSGQAADALAAVLKNDGKDAAIQGAALSSALPHLTRLAAIIANDTDSAHDKLLGSLFRCALDKGNEDAVAAIVSRMSTPSRLREVLAVLDERNLSLGSFTASLKSPTAQAGAKQAMDLLAQAAMKVREAGTAPPMAELQLLAQDHDHRAEIARMLPALWERASLETASALLPLIARLQPAQTPEFLLAEWNQRTPSQRQQIIGTLLTNDAWTLALLERIRSKQVDANACDAAMRARLLKHPKADVQKLAAAVFADSTTAARATVLEKFKPALTLTGDPARGKTAFQQVCISCHKLDNVGLELGPDLRSVVGHDAEKLMNSILDPSAVIEPGFMAYHCTLKSGEQLYGVIATETSTSLTLKMPGNLVRPILRSDIASLKSTNTSLMPDGLEAALTPQSLADLIAYLKLPK